MHCNTNILKYTSRRILKAINSTSYDQENEVCDHEFQLNMIKPLHEKPYKHLDLSMPHNEM